MKRWLWILFLTGEITVPASGFHLPANDSGRVVIRGTDPGYSGKILFLTIEPSPFSSLPYRAREIQCDDSGSFRATFDLPEGRVIYLNTGIYEAYLFVRPGFNYRVKLPVYRELAYIDQVSPYFKPLSLPLMILDRRSIETGITTDGPEDVNHRVARFDSLFHIVNEQVIMNRRLGVDSKLDSLVRRLETIYPEDTSDYFTAHRKYRYGFLQLNEGKTGLAAISREFLGPSIRDSHPGFMELFRTMFKDFLVYYARTPEGKELPGQINHHHDLQAVRNTLTGHPAVWNDTVADMILLQELPSLFYGGFYHKASILILLDSMTSHPVREDFLAYSRELNERLSSLLTGHSPPHISMADLLGKPYHLEDSKGRYVYLMFCTPEHYGCMTEYPFLRSYHQRLSEYLEVITIMVATTREEVIDFMSRNGYEWRAFYFGDQPGILEDYLIKAFPTAYLIGPDGRMVLSPASMPSDGLEQQLFRIMRSRGEL